MKKLLLTLVLMAFAPVQAFACSPNPGYVRPSNFELIQLADAIVIARTTGREYTEKTESGYEYSVVPASLVKTLKGSDVPAELKLTMNLGETTPSDPDELLAPHPEAMMGPCNRYSVAPATDYVIFLQQDSERGWQIFNWFPFTRIVEDYHGDESPWMKAIRYYLEVQSGHDPMGQLAALERRYNDILENDTATPYEKALALDIANHLMSRSPYKPTEYLIASYKALSEGKALPFSLRPPSADKEDSDAQRLTDMLFGVEDAPFDNKARMDFILWSLANGEHPTAKPFMLSLLKANSASAASVGAAVQYLARHDSYLEAMDIVRERGLLLAATRPLDEVDDFVRGAFGIHYNPKDYKKPLWMAEPTVAAWWPEYHFALVQVINARRGDENWGVPDAVLEAIRPENYRDNPDIAIALVREYDDAVVEWAKAEMDRLLDAEVEAYEQDYALPIGILLEDYRPDDTETIEALFCGSEDSRYVLLKFIGIHQTIYTEDLLARVALSENLSEDHWETLLKSYAMFAGHSRREYVKGASMWGSDAEFDLMSQLIKGEKPDFDDDIKPITCE